MNTKIERFKGEYFFLSNFYETPVFFEGLQYRNSEAAFQGAKCLALESDVDHFLIKHHLDPALVDRVLRSKIKDVLTMQLRMPFIRLSAAEAKKQGRHVPLRNDWEDQKEWIMLQIVRSKFEDPTLAQKLLDTGKAELIEGNTWNDTFWGSVNGEGENRLGKILEQVRDEIEEERFYSNLEFY